MVAHYVVTIDPSAAYVAIIEYLWGLVSGVAIGLGLYHTFKTTPVSKPYAIGGSDDIRRELHMPLSTDKCPVCMQDKFAWYRCHRPDCCDGRNLVRGQ